MKVEINSGPVTNVMNMEAEINMPARAPICRPVDRAVQLLCFLPPCLNKLNIGWPKQAEGTARVGACISAEV